MVVQFLQNRRKDSTDRGPTAASETFMENSSSFFIQNCFGKNRQSRLICG